MRHLLLALSAACAVTAAAAAASSYVIVGDRAVGGVRIGHGTVADARVAFGAPSSLRAQSAQICVARWSPIGLTMRFLDFAGTPCRSGGLVTAVVTSRNAFRTTLGLRVGDSTARLKRLFPHARFRTDPHPPWTGYWLIPRRTCKEVGRLPYPGLLARVRAGRVIRARRADDRLRVKAGPALHLLDAQAGQVRPAVKEPRDAADAARDDRQRIGD